MATTKIRFFLPSWYLSHFWIFSFQNFLKFHFHAISYHLMPFMPFHTISCHILIIWGKFLVLITIICYPKIRWSLNSLTGGCCPYDSQSSTEQISIMLAFFNRKFSWDPFLNVVFFGMSFFLVCRLFWYVVFFGMSFFLVCRFFLPLLSI